MATWRYLASQHADPHFHIAPGSYARRQSGCPLIRTQQSRKQQFDTMCSVCRAMIWLTNCSKHNNTSFVFQHIMTWSEGGGGCVGKWVIIRSLFSHSKRALALSPCVFWQHYSDEFCIAVGVMFTDQSRSVKSRIIVPDNSPVIPWLCCCVGFRQEVQPRQNIILPVMDMKRKYFSSITSVFLSVYIFIWLNKNKCTFHLYPSTGKIEELCILLYNIYLKLVH